MKIKIDFITNSSTTSFAAWGVNLGEFNLRNNVEFMKQMYEMYKNENKSETKSFEVWSNDSDLRYDICEFIESKTKLSCINGEYGDEIYVGMTPGQMKDDETKKQFIDSIREEFKKIGLFNCASVVDWIEVSWRDG